MKTIDWANLTVEQWREQWKREKEKIARSTLRGIRKEWKERAARQDAKKKGDDL